MHTDESPQGSPATIVSVRPVTLRPYFSISLPSDCTVFDHADQVKPYGTNGLVSRMNGKQGSRDYQI